MISEGAFWTSVSKVKILSNKLKLTKELGVKKGKYSSHFLSVMYLDNYREIYDGALNNGDFELILKDESFFQFSFDTNGYSLAFYPRPSVFIDFDQWLTTMFSEISNFKPEEFEKFKEEMLIDGDTNSEYEQFLIETETLQSVVPVRFDCDSVNYSEVYHPLCHLHIGLSNNIRIAIDKFITPLLFFEFIIKNYYPDTFFYKDKTGKCCINEIIALTEKHSCMVVSNDKFNNENLLLYFT